MLQKLLFTKGMNSDDSPEVIPEGMGPYRLNVRIMSSNDGNDESAEPVKGNTLISYTLPSGANFVIGSQDYKIGKKVFYFVYNSSGNHSILQFDYSATTITLVFQDSILNFSATHLITGISVIKRDDNNHLLYWTDRYNEPRKINIEKGIYYSAGNYTLGYTFPFDPYNLYRIKKPPTIPTYVWANDPTQKINYNFKKLFKFRVQFVYDDFEESALSMESQYEFPVTTGAVGSGEDIATQDNQIIVTVPTGSEIVTKIRILGKELLATTYSVVAELDKSLLSIASNSTYNFTFLNDGIYSPVDPKRQAQLYDFVPLLSQSETTIKGTKILDGLITEGYNNVSIDMNLPVTYEIWQTNPNSFYPATSYHKSGGVYKKGIIYYDEQGNRSGLTNIVRAPSTSTLNGVAGSIVYFPFLTESAYGAPHLTPNTDMEYVPILNVEIYNEPPSWATRYCIATSKNEAMDRYIQFAVESVRYVDINGVQVPSYAHSSAIFVEVIIKNIYDRYAIENPNSRLVYDYIKGDRVRFIANPSGVPAAYTEIDSFFSFNDQETVSFDASSGILKVKMTPTTPTNIVMGCLFEVYQPAENVILDNEIMYESGNVYDIVTDSNGNRVHAGTSNQSFVPTTGVINATPYYQCVVAGGHGLVVGDKVKLVGSGYSIYGAVVVSGVTSITIDTTGYTLFGTFIGTAATIIKAATFVYQGGDCFRRQQDMPWVFGGAVFRLYQLVEAQSAANLWVSNAYDFGRPNRIDDTFKQITRESTMYWSENFVPETGINGLSTVYDTNFGTAPDYFGGIYKLWSTDQWLRVFQESRVGRLPVNMILYNGVTGEQNVGTSADVLADQMDYYGWAGGIGTHPESFSFYGEVAYFMDVNNGTPCRLSNNGITPIGDTGKMHNYFTAKCAAILTRTPKVNICGVYDVRFGEYIISFSHVAKDSPAETLAWNEKNNQWSSYYSYLPDFMCSYGVNIISFSAGSLYTHNTNSVYNNFYGVQYTSIIHTYCNTNPSNIKVFEAISLESDSVWETTLETPSGQTTTMTSGNYRQKEGFWYTEVLRDDNTPNTSATPAILPNARWLGNPMRGQYALVKLDYKDTDFTTIFACNVRVIPSQRSNQ
jgi:hypothetical protein